MSIVLQYALPAMGVCKNFPRSLVFVPKDFFGHGIKHLFAALTTDSLANSTWYFLDKNNISLKTDIMVQPPQIGDTVQVEELNKNSSRFV
jgi:hypothetical protein